jgi:hypothetical protein
VGELQHFLRAAALLQPQQSEYFRVNPEDVALPMLKGWCSRAQLDTTWGIFSKWLALGKDFFYKYVKQVRCPESITSYSPTSMAQELQDEM